jgi:hypothetical protein
MGVFQNTALALFPLITGSKNYIFELSGTLFSQFSENGKDPDRGSEY